MKARMLDDDTKCEANSTLFFMGKGACNGRIGSAFQADLIVCNKLDGPSVAPSYEACASLL